MFKQIREAMQYLVAKWGIAWHDRSHYGDVVETIRRQYDFPIRVAAMEYRDNLDKDLATIRCEEYGGAMGFILVKVYQVEAQKQPRIGVVNGGKNAVNLFERGALNLLAGHYELNDLYKYLEGDMILPEFDPSGFVEVWFMPVFKNDILPTELSAEFQ